MLPGLHGGQGEAQCSDLRDVIQGGCLSLANGDLWGQVGGGGQEPEVLSRVSYSNKGHLKAAIQSAWANVNQSLWRTAAQSSAQGWSKWLRLTGATLNSHQQRNLLKLQFVVFVDSPKMDLKSLKLKVVSFKHPALYVHALCLWSLCVSSLWLLFLGGLIVTSSPPPSIAHAAHICHSRQFISPLLCTIALFFHSFTLL